MEVKTEADADCMILEYPCDDDKWPTVGMLLHSVICFCFACFIIFYLHIWMS